MANQNITHNMGDENAIFKYLCPSMLSANDIIEELKIRCFKIKGLERKNRDELTQIFIRHLMPLPQRTFPDNHHGKLINKMIQKENLSRRSGKTEDRSKITLQIGFSDKKHESKPYSRGSTSSISGDRLKPPIDSGEGLSRKLSLAKTPHSASKPCLDKVIINDRSKERKMSTDSDSRSSVEGTVETKTTQLKRSHSSPEETEACSPSKKSRQRIAWP